MGPTDFIPSANRGLIVTTTTLTMVAPRNVLTVTGARRLPRQVPVQDLDGAVLPNR